MVITEGIKNEVLLLQRHVRIMKILRDGPMGIVRLSQLTGLPMHQVRYSLRILQQSDFLEPSTKGAILNAKGKEFFGSFEKEKRRLAKELNKI